jgi:hypothetical protein
MVHYFMQSFDAGVEERAGIERNATAVTTLLCWQTETQIGPIIPLSRKFLANDLHINRMKQEMRVTR